MLMITAWLSRELLDAGHAHARIEVARVELRELDDLRVDVDLAGRHDRADAGRGVALLDAASMRSVGAGLVDERAQRVVEDRGRVARRRRRRSPRRSAARGPRSCGGAGTRRSRRGARARSRRAGSRASGCSTTRSRPAGPCGTRRRDRVPPALRRALVLAERAVEQAHEQVAVVRDHVAQDRRRELGPSAPRSRATPASSVPSARGERGIVGDVA